MPVRAARAGIIRGASVARRVEDLAQRSALCPDRYRGRLLRRAGVDIHPSALVFSGLRLVGSATVTICEGAFINHDCLLEASADIWIGPRVSLGNEVAVLTSEHDHSDPRQRGGSRRLHPVRIEAGVWLGARSTVLPGVTIGEGCVIGATSLVTSDCASHGLYVGAPARRVRELPT